MAEIWGMWRSSGPLAPFWLCSVIPGWVINVAAIVHRDEALLVVGLTLIGLILGSMLFAYI